MLYIKDELIFSNNIFIIIYKRVLFDITSVHCYTRTKYRIYQLNYSNWPTLAMQLAHIVYTISVDQSLIHVVSLNSGLYGVVNRTQWQVDYVLHVQTRNI